MILLLDTAHQPSWVAVAHAGSIKSSREIEDRHALSDTLLASVDRVLDEVGTAAADLDGIGVVTGPGTFTALRIGLSIANALALAEDLPVVGVPAADAASRERFATIVKERLEDGSGERQALPEYGKPPSITPPSGAA